MRRRRQNNPESLTNSSDIEPQRNSEDVAPQRSQNENQLLERLITQQAEAFEGLSKQIASLQFSIETLKRDQAQSISHQNEVVPQKVDFQEIIKPNLKSKDELISIFQEFLTQFLNSETKSTALKNLRLWFQNIVNNPNDQLKSRINTTNSVYKSSFAVNKAAGLLFETVGFVTKGSLWEFDASYLDSLQIMLEMVQEEVAKIPLPKFNSTAPWKMTKSDDGGKIEEKKEEEERKEVEKKDETQSNETRNETDSQIEGNA